MRAETPSVLLIFFIILLKECLDKYYGSSKIYLFPNLKFSAFFKSKKTESLR